MNLFFEVGHWLNLRHIWGDATCGSDLVTDTPTHNTANYGCPAAGHRSTCTGTPIEMTMNYMDYTDDACMYMFSAGQKSRMLATFASGGVNRSSRYGAYYILHSVPRKSNPSGTMDADQYLVKIAVSARSTGAGSFEAFMTAWLAAAQSEASLQLV
mgnify:CR=1 FL=1